MGILKQKRSHDLPDSPEMAPIQPGNMSSDNTPRSHFFLYASINFAFYITMTFNGYVTVFLQSIGFNAQLVGTVTALNSGVGIVSSPLWGMLSDKHSLKKVINFTLSVGALLFALIPWAGGMRIGRVSLLFLVIPAAQFFRAPVMSLIDNWMLKNANREKLNYGALRAYGAFSYALAAIVLGFVIPKTGVELIFYINIVFTIPALLLLVFIKGSADDQGVTKKSLTLKEMQIGQLFTNYYLVAYILFSAVQRIPFQSSMTFLPFLVAETGGDIAQVGIVMGLRALVEIPMMMLLKPLRQKVPLYTLIIAATGVFILECLLNSIAVSFSMVVLISVLHGIGNGLMITAGASYVFTLAPEHLKATAQTLLASVNAVAGILGGVLGGLLIVLFDIKRFYFMLSIMLSAALILFVLSFIVGEKLLGLKRPGLSLH